MRAWSGPVACLFGAALCLPTATPRGGDPEAASSCGTCHTAIYGEWQHTAHANAWTDPIYQKAHRGRDKAEACYPCHAPEAVLDRLGKRPRTRERNRDEGVTCVACHQQGGRMHGPFDLATTAHATEQDATFGDRASTALCTGCHELRIADVLPLAREFAGSSLPGKGRSCVGCHMPEVTRPLAVDEKTGQATTPARPGRSHAVLGPGDADFCGDAFAIALERKEGTLWLHVRNRAGHGIPGLVGLRTFPLRAALLDTQGKTLHEQELVFSSDNRLLVDEDRRMLLDDRPGTLAVRVRVDHVFAGKTVATIVDRKLDAK